MTKFISRVFVVVLLLLGTSDVSFAQRPNRLPTTDLTVGIYLVKAEVAASEAQRRQGLMFREKMGVNEGMLFAYDAPIRLCMWMKNTPLALSVAFIDADGRIINIEDMQPHTERTHCSKKSVPYALEMNRGWFKERNIMPGGMILGLPTGR